MQKRSAKYLSKMKYKDKEKQEKKLKQTETEINKKANNTNNNNKEIKDTDDEALDTVSEKKKKSIFKRKFSNTLVNIFPKLG